MAHILTRGFFIKIKIASSVTRAHISRLREIQPWISILTFVVKCFFLPTLLVLVRYDYIHSSAFATFQFQDEINRECVTRSIRGGYAPGSAPWNRNDESKLELTVNYGGFWHISQRSRYLLGIRLIARNGLNTLIVRMADRFIFSTFRQYSKALQPSHFLNFFNYIYFNIYHSKILL